MASKYYIRYFDLEDIEHRLDIYDDNYIGESTQIDGKILLTYSETDDNLEAIRGQGLSVSLEANTGLTFADLWSNEEKTFRIEYKRNSIILFQGWLNPEGFFEDFVSTDWIVSFDCVDGLGFLTDLSFVEDSTGFPITGRKTQLEILSKALLRTGLYLNINTAIDIRYTGLIDTLNPLTNVYVNTDRYVKDDGETIMSCEEVIRDILEPYRACITSFNGEWYIYKPNQLYSNRTVVFSSYTYLGAVSVTPTKTIDTSLLIGSQSNNITPFHCNANQTIRNTSSLGGYRINYKYGLATDLVLNTNLYSSDGVTIDGWNILDPTKVTVNGAGQYGVNIATSITPIEVLRSPLISSLINIELTLKAIYTGNSNTGVSGIYDFIYHIRLFGNSSTSYYYNALTNAWDITITPIENSNGSQYGYEEELNVLLPKLPENGVITVGIYQPDSGATAGLVDFHKLSLVNLTETPTELKGEFHTFQRTLKPASKVDDVKTVATGDIISDIYEGALYQNNSTSLTRTWYRKGVTESKPLLQIMGEETLRMNQLPARVFSGDIFGYFPYLSVISIDGLSGLFMPIKYSYDTKENIISAELKQIYGNELTDINYEKTFDYGNVVKPTIR